MAQDLQDLACFRPSLGCSASLVLDRDRVALDEGGELLGPLGQGLASLDVALGMSQLPLLGLQVPFSTGHVATRATRQKISQRAAEDVLSWADTR